MREWVQGARTKEGKIIIHHIIEMVGAFLPMIEMDREVLNEKFKEHESWLEFAACILDGQDEFVVQIYDSAKLEFFEFIDGNGFKVNRIGIISSGHTSLGYVLKVKKC